MYELAARLPDAAIVLDLGSGGGSFNYRRTNAAVISADVAFPNGSPAGAAALMATAAQLPLPSGSVDLVVCNHTLEHFPELSASIDEIARVLKRGGSLWAAVPNGSSLDDRLYRFLFKGGGHVNRFSLESFLAAVQKGEGLCAVSCKKLRSGFVYLRPPSPESLRHFPFRAKVAAGLLPASIQTLCLRWLNLLVRILDRRLSTRWSAYGWAVTFEKSFKRPGGGGELVELPEDVNVCFGCGSGHAAETLQGEPAFFGLLATYACPGCGTVNFKVET